MAIKKNIVFLTSLISLLATAVFAIHQNPEIEQVVLTQDSETSKNVNLVKLITLFRHGAATAERKLFENEWKAYKIEGPDEGEGLLTALGFGQCWSAGSYMKLRYSEFFEEISKTSSYEINIGPKKKSKLCSQYIWEGIQERVPYIGIYEADLVREAFELRGNCEKCPEMLAFPFENSQTLTEEAKPKTNLNFVTHPNTFIDQDDTCYDIKKLSYKETDPIPMEDLEYIRGLDSENAEFTSINAMRSVGKHLYHNLPSLDISEELTKRAYQSIFQEPKGILAYFTHEQKLKWGFQALFARNIMKDLMGKISNGNDWVSYMIHDNNFLAFLVFMIGYDQEMADYGFGFASSLNFEIYEETSTGEKFVKMNKDGEVLEMADCGIECPIDQFQELIEQYSVLGGDLDAICEILSSVETNKESL